MTREARDALIVGAGPAGSTAAILLARAGARVTIVDKARFPRDKLCGEFVSPEAVRILGALGVLPVISARAGRAGAVLLSDASGRTVRITLPRPSVTSPEALGIARREMDALLLERAAREGAEVALGVEMLAPVYSEDRAIGIVGRERGSGREVRIEARFLLAADGRDSPLARAIDPGPFRGRGSSLFGLKAHFRGVAGFGGSVELHYFQGGYVGLHEIGGGRVNVCALIDRSVAGTIPREPEQIAREVFFSNTAARARLEGAERISEWLAVGSLVFRADAPVRAGALFLGDAAGTIDPFAGEGMSMAFRSAEIAAEELVRVLSRGEGGASAVRSENARVCASYARRWRREFALRIGICRTLGRLAPHRTFQTPVIAALRAIPLAGRLLARGTRAGTSLGLTTS